RRIRGVKPLRRGAYLKIGIIGKTNIEKTFELVSALSKWLVDRGVEVYLDKPLAKRSPAGKAAAAEKIPSLVDIILVFGGDGTFLGVARLASKHGTPILGINLGGLGFLTEVTVDEIHPMMERILAGDYEVEDRH